jgi:hypothetical protein
VSVCLSVCLSYCLFLACGKSARPSPLAGHHGFSPSELHMAVPSARLPAVSTLEWFHCVYITVFSRTHSDGHILTSWYHGVILGKSTPAQLCICASDGDPGEGTPSNELGATCTASVLEEEIDDEGEDDGLP